MNGEKRVQMAAIAGASHALKYKRKNVHASDDEALQEVARQMESILDQIGKDE